MPPHRSMRHRHALTFPSAIGPVASQSQLITGHQCESAHRGGEPSPPQPLEGSQSGKGQDGLRWGRTSPGYRRPRKHRRRGAVPARALQKGGSIPFPRTHRGSGKTPRETQKGGAAQQGAFQGREEPPGGSGKSPTFPWMQDIPERLRLRLGWTPRPPVSGSSKPSLILL